MLPGTAPPTAAIIFFFRHRLASCVCTSDSLFGSVSHFFFSEKEKESCRRHFGNIPNIQTVITRRHFRVVGGCTQPTTSPHTQVEEDEDDI